MGAGEATGLVTFDCFCIWCAKQTYGDLEKIASGEIVDGDLEDGTMPLASTVLPPVGIGECMYEFEQMDQNQNGTLDQSEVLSAVSKLFP